MIDLDAIQRAAEQAPHGPWKQSETDDLIVHVEGYSTPRGRIADAYDEGSAAHIAAADPSTVLALVAAVRAAREAVRLDRMHADCGDWCLADTAYRCPVSVIRDALAPFGGDGQP